MPIRSIEEAAAVARLSCLKFLCPVPEAAQVLARWQAAQSALLVPVSIQLQTDPQAPAPRTSADFKARARSVRGQVASWLGLDTKAAAKVSFQVAGNRAWFLGPRPNLDVPSMLDAVGAAPEKFIELMLLKELVEAAAVNAQDTFVSGGFGPSAYLGSLSEASKKYLHLAEAVYTVRTKHQLLLCDVKAKVFAKNARGRVSEESSSATRAADAGDGFMVGVTRIVPSDYDVLDARKSPMEGISLKTTKVRRSRLYYLNVLTEFASALFKKAGVPFEHDTFVASHCVDEAYIPLAPLASLKRSLVVVNASGQPMSTQALRPLEHFAQFMPGYHVAGNKKTQFRAPVVQAADDVPTQLDPELNYLFLSGEPDEKYGTVRLARKGSAQLLQPYELSAAYSALAKGDHVADPYTDNKFRHLLAQDTFRFAMQGLDATPAAVAALTPGTAADEARQLQEALKRCLVELSLKEVLRGDKALAAPAIPAELGQFELTLLATRRMRMGRQQPKQLAAAVDVTVDAGEIRVARVRRTPWNDETSIIDFVEDFPFLQERGKNWIPDGQFWVLDKASGLRLTVWSGAYVPRLILNDRYAGIEAALGAQDELLERRREQGKGKVLSKGREFNLLPYYISMYAPGAGVRNERIGTRIPLQDRGAFVRLFVPPEGGIKGSGDKLSCMRDLMLYEADGHPVDSQMLQQPLVHLYLHTLTNGVLVGGDNSKMSILEKLARLALEN